MTEVSGTHEHLSCPKCSYCLGGHDLCRVVTCPECGGMWHRVDLDRLALGRGRFRTWMLPVFCLPAAGLTLLDNFAGIGWRDAAVIPPTVFVVLLAMAYFALRDHRGIERLGTAIVMAEFLWLASALLARFLPWLPV